MPVRSYILCALWKMVGDCVRFAERAARCALSRTAIRFTGWIRAFLRILLIIIGILLLLPVGFVALFLMSLATLIVPGLMATMTVWLVDENVRAERHRLAVWGVLSFLIACGLIAVGLMISDPICLPMAHPWFADGGDGLPDCSSSVFQVIVRVNTTTCMAMSVLIPIGWILEAAAKSVCRAWRFLKTAYQDAMARCMAGEP